MSATVDYNKAMRLEKLALIDYRPPSRFSTQKKTAVENGLEARFHLKAKICWRENSHGADDPRDWQPI